MPWPLDADYQDAIQDPRVCFSDAELRSGEVIADDFGPWMAWGGFAVVFQIAAGQKRYAVRCFKSTVTDQQRRYGAISTYLRQLRNPAFADVEFQNSGIKVKGAHYPIVKMEWVSGERLDAYVGKQMSKPRILLNLRDEFRRLAKTLRDNGIAHGDLQHRNIIVTPPGRMRLVDYDGIFVPGIVAACGPSSPEVGHPNFQHPRRGAGDFNQEIDNFSVLVIYLSLWALAEHPDLWSDKVFHNEDTLIFQDHDFVDQNSKLLERLAKSPQAGIRKMAEILRAECRKASASDVGDLESVLRDIGGHDPAHRPDIVVTDATGGEIDELVCSLVPTGPWQWSARAAFRVCNDGNASAEVAVSSTDKTLQVTPAGAFALGPGETRELSLEVVSLDNEPIKIAAELNLTVGTAAEWWDQSSTASKGRNQAAPPRNWWEQVAKSGSWLDKPSLSANSGDQAAPPKNWWDPSPSLQNLSNPAVPSKNWWDPAAPSQNLRGQAPVSDNPWDPAAPSQNLGGQVPPSSNPWGQNPPPPSSPGQTGTSVITIPVKVEKVVPRGLPATDVRTPTGKRATGWALCLAGAAVLAMCVLWGSVIVADLVSQGVTGEDKELAFFLAVGVIFGPLMLVSGRSRLASREAKCPKCSETVEFAKMDVMTCRHCAATLAVTDNTMQAVTWGSVAKDPVFRLSLKDLKLPSQWRWPRPHLCCVCGCAARMNYNIEVVSGRFAQSTKHVVSVPHCVNHSGGVRANRRGQFLGFKSRDCQALFDDLNRR